MDMSEILEYLKLFYEITLYVLPFFAIILIIYLLVLIVKLSKTIKKANVVVDNINNSWEKVDNILVKTEAISNSIDESMGIIQEPLKVTAKIFTSVELLHDFTYRTVMKMIDETSRNLNTIKDWLNSLINKKTVDSTVNVDEPIFTNEEQEKGE
ncbi:MAG: hypothetical protein WBO70_03975 [Erysipelotrichaceae bacterium]